MPIFSLELLNESINFSIILHPKEAIKKGIPVQLFIVIFLCLLGIVLTIISQFTNLFYYFDENNIYHRSPLYPLSVVLGLLPGLITLTMFLQNRKKFAKNVFVTLLILMRSLEKEEIDVCVVQLNVYIDKAHSNS